MKDDYKPNDRVVMTKIGLITYGNQSDSGVGTVMCDCSPWSVRWDNGRKYDYNKQDIELATKQTKMATLTEKMRIAFKGEPEKSFIKAGVMNVDETLTTEGNQVFTAWLLKKNGADFKKEVVDPILAEEESKS